MGKGLTKVEMISYLLEIEENEIMKGIIRVKGKCSICKDKFVEVKKLGFICPIHKTSPKRFYIDLFLKGQRIRIFTDQHGQPLDSYQRSLNLLSHINYEIQNFSFDPTKYVKQEVVKFYVENLLEKFLDYKSKDIAPSYKKDYKRYVEIAQKYFSATDIRELRRIDLINYKEHLENNYEFGNKTIKNVLDNFKTFLNYAKNDLEILDVVPSFPKIETTIPKTNWLSQDVQREIIESISIDDKPIFIFLMLHGCRPGEARALKCKDIDLGKGIIKISATFSGRVYREKRKGKSAKPVIIPIHHESYDYIKMRIENNLPLAYLFINPKTGKHYSENKLKKIWNEVREKVGIDKSIRLYDATRHSVASQLVNKGVSLFNVSKLLGHSNTKMTEKYSHHDIENLKIDIKNLSLKDQSITDLSHATNSNL